jgi:hypothetical protein
MGAGHEPFCSVLLEQVSESSSVSKRAVLPAKPDGLAYPPGTGPTQTQIPFCPVAPSSLHKAAISTIGWRSDKWQIVTAG